MRSDSNLCIEILPKRRWNPKSPTMAASCAYCTRSPISVSPFPHRSPTLRFFRNRIPCSKSPLTEPLNSDSRTKFMEFPYVSAPHRDLMVQLVSSVETRLESALQPCTLPPDVQYYQNPTGSSHGSLHVLSGLPSSRIDFILGSWVHCKLPTGGALNITSLTTYLRPSTDAPNFLIDIIRSSPVSLILILDLSPRKDLVLHPEYLKEFYEDTQLDRHRQLLEKLPEVRPYVSSSLYTRSVVSPCAVMVSIEAPADQTSRIEEIIRDHISPIAKEMLETWLDMCACVEREVGGDESGGLGRRDQIIKNKTIEIDLGSSFPRLFGEEVANRVLGVLRDIYNA